MASTILTDRTRHDGRAFLPTITCPTLVAFEADPKMDDPRAGRMISDSVPGSRYLEFEASSHMPFLEEPQAFDVALADWVSQLP